MSALSMQRTSCSRPAFSQHVPLKGGVSSVHRPTAPPSRHTLLDHHVGLSSPAARRMGPMRAGGYMEGDRLVQDDVASMRRKAEQNVQQLLQSLDSKSAAAKSGAGGAGAEGSISSAMKAKLQNAVKAMQQGLVERDTEVRLLLLAAMSGEHILLIGPPGTAKSEVGRRMNKLISGTFFERLLTRFSVPEELFGPLSMRALEEDRYVRQTRGYLPEAEVAFIDEIFKANSAILNTLLTIINERQFDNGSTRERVPLLTVVGASNELPESEELDALYDRFLVRRQVHQVSAAGVAQMLQYYSENASGSSGGNGTGTQLEQGGMDAMDPGMQLGREDIRACKAQALARVRVPATVIQLITDLRTYLQEKVEPPVYISDRRLVKAIQLLQVAAYCNGRDTVTEYDALLLQHVLWQRPEQADKIADWVVSQLSVDDGLKQVQYLLSGLFSRACRSLGNPDKVNELQEEVNSLRGVLVEKYMQVADNLEGGFPVVLDNLWLGEEESNAIATSLQPKLTRTRAAVVTVLHDVGVLEMALQSGSDPVTLANLMPRHWAEFIRNSDISEVRPIGTRPFK
mmetsp:Transcript_21554/g.59746  ORF Transcript_21554/g.59746 Transcript_21554/m.59746 type:complete len:571 (+) Transcript_21554:16-1728(+)|eukprot:CAMPEP_0202377884 /NCGR_PEP_ID=MMETSP1127-20130417/14217_1 /ASSEMBLY_ACC=CAM_ASM_000462 /TAXON_ID=3047 /ORGANISM="Dunaliella tertiolecta, Strain CCMP1320" /LENGTH=570 /DNA_ID=CAMNT_0048976035 /DNA_START=8 /DNA_END=1720 /DNA_ORIENTATION=+